MNAKMNFLTDKKFLVFCLKFLLIFGVLYLGTLALIGLASPDGYYSPFVDHYLDYVSWIKYSLIYSTKFILGLFGITTEVVPEFVVRYPQGKGVFIAMDCVGYGVYSFWIAFVTANRIAPTRKLAWAFAGVLILWLINVTRISLFLVSLNKHWPMPFGIDHHTWFDIAAYIAIFIMIWIFDKRLSDKQNKTADASRPV